MRADARGILGLPLKLAVAMLVMAAMVPLVAGMVSTAEDSLSSADAQSDAESLADAASRAYYGGEGTSVAVSVSLQSGQSILMGGDGGLEYVLRITDGGEEVSRVYITAPAVPVLGGVTEVSGDALVTFTCATVDGVYGVTVSVS